MSLKETVNGQFDRAKGFVDRLRARYIDAYVRALELSNERLDDLTRLSGTLGPSFRDAVETRIEGLRRHIDDLNRALAEKAIPLDRKARVGRMALNEKARKAGQGLRLVKSAAVDEAVEAIKSATRVAESLIPAEKPAEKPDAVENAAPRKSPAKPGTARPAQGKAGKGTKTSPKKAATTSADKPATAGKVGGTVKGRGKATSASSSARAAGGAPRKKAAKGAGKASKPSPSAS